MNIETTHIDGLLIIDPTVFEDERGLFFESFNEKRFASKTGLTDVEFVQDNQSESKANVLRGLHFQAPPHQQGKLVRVVKGKVLDVAVDIRKTSPTYGEYHSVILSDSNKKMFWIPPGFAHGFLTIEPSIFCYKCAGYYNKESEGSLLWNDRDLNIDWGISNPLLSEKDSQAPKFKNFESPFE